MPAALRTIENSGMRVPILDESIMLDALYANSSKSEKHRSRRSAPRHDDIEVPSERYAVKDQKA